MTDSAPRLVSRLSTGAPRVSVVMPTYRRAHQIGDSIHSLLKGSFTDFELLIRDDGNGHDGTEMAVRKAVAGDSRVSYHRNPQNLGMPGNLNSGIMAAHGELIAVCHDHDLYTGSFLERMVQALDAHRSALFVHCAINVIQQDGAYYRSYVGGWPELTPGDKWLHIMLEELHCPVCALTVVRRSAHERYGLYDPQYGFISDVEMWMRLARYGDVAYVREPLIDIREREDDHEATRLGYVWIKTAGRIHRRYLQHVYRGPELAWRRLRLERRVWWRVLNDLARRVYSFLQLPARPRVNDPIGIEAKDASSGE